MLRIFSILVAGLGVAVLVGAAIAPKFLLGDGRLPLDLTETTWTMSDPAGRYRGETMPLTRQLHMEILDPADAGTVAVRIGDTLRAGEAERDFDNLVVASTWSYPLDRVSGDAVAPMELRTVMGMPPESVEGQGAWLKFPSNVDMRSYEVFDPQLRGAAEARFVDAQEIAGREVYRFRQVIEPTNLADLYADVHTTTTLAGPEGEQGEAFLFHAATRDILVDQVSGFVVGMDEAVDDYYGDAAGVRLADYVTYDATMPREQVEATVAQLGTVFSQAQSRALTIGLMVVGGLIALAGVIGALVPRRKTGAADERRDCPVALLGAG